MSRSGDFKNIRTKIFDYIEVYYNRKRMHSTIDYMTPEEYELNAAYLIKRNVIGSRIQQARAKAGLSQVELAAAMCVNHKIKMQRATISHIESRNLLSFFLFIMRRLCFIAHAI